MNYKTLVDNHYDPIIHAHEQAKRSISEGIKQVGLGQVLSIIGNQVQTEIDHEKRKNDADLRSAAELFLGIVMGNYHRLKKSDQKLAKNMLSFESVKKTIDLIGYGESFQSPKMKEVHAKIEELKK